MSRVTGIDLSQKFSRLPFYLHLHLVGGGLYSHIGIPVNDPEAVVNSTARPVNTQRS